jgi:hypothetical protein
MKNIIVIFCLLVSSAFLLYAQEPTTQQTSQDTNNQSLKTDKPIIIGVGQPVAGQRQTTINTNMGGVAVGNIVGKIVSPAGGALGVKMYTMSNSYKLTDVKKLLLKAGVKQKDITKIAPKFLETLKNPMTKRVAVLVGATGMAIGVIDLLQKGQESSIYITPNYAIDANQSDTTLSVLARALVDSSGVDVDEYLKANSLSSLKITVGKSTKMSNQRKYILGGIIGLVVLIIFVILQKKGIMN